MSSTIKLGSLPDINLELDSENIITSKSKPKNHSQDLMDDLKISFVFSSGSYFTYNYSFIKDFCFIFKKEKRRSSLSKTLKVKVPELINEEDFKEFISHSAFNKEKILWNYSFETIEKVFIMCEFFKNYELLKDIVIHNVNPNLNFNNAINLLEFSFQKLSNSHIEIKEIFFKLFYESIHFISKNFIFYLDRLENTLTKINKKILEEIVSKFLQLLYNDGLNELIEKSHDDKIINIILKLREMTDIFDLLVNENFRSNSEENILEMEDLKPILVLSIDKDFTQSFYKETEQIIVEKQILIVNYFYNKNDDLFSVNIKSYFYQSGMSSFFPVSFLSTAVNLEINNQNKKTYKVISLSEKDKIFHNILSIANFSKIIKNTSLLDDSIKLSIHIKVCFIHSMIYNYLLYNLKNLCNNTSISKISKMDIETILYNKLYTEASEDQIVKILMSWLSDQINVNEKIKELIDLINWKCVSFGTALEFTVKFYKVIENLSLQEEFRTILTNCVNYNYKSSSNYIESDYLIIIVR